MLNFVNPGLDRASRGLRHFRKSSRGIAILAAGRRQGAAAAAAAGAAVHGRVSGSTDGQDNRRGAVRKSGCPLFFIVFVFGAACARFN